MGSVIEGRLECTLCGWKGTAGQLVIIDSSLTCPICRGECASKDYDDLHAGDKALVPFLKEIISNMLDRNTNAAEIAFDIGEFPVTLEISIKSIAGQTFDDFYSEETTNE